MEEPFQVPCAVGAFPQPFATSRVQNEYHPHVQPYTIPVVRGQGINTDITILQICLSWVVLKVLPLSPSGPTGFAYPEDVSRTFSEVEFWLVAMLLQLAFLTMTNIRHFWVASNSR